jgi:hypothetical protein
LIIDVDVDEYEVFGFRLEFCCREHLTDVLLAEPSPHGAKVHEHHSVRRLGHLEALV